MISYEDALKHILDIKVALGTEVVSLEDSLGRIARENIQSRISNPAFNNSAMDGYAVRSEDTKSASQTQPLMLDIVGSTQAGATIKDVAKYKNTAWEIMTGAPISDEYDAVIRIEDVEIIGNKIQIVEPVKLKDNVRFAGEDFKKGDVILEFGTRIAEQHIMGLAAAGISKVVVSKRPKVSLISTGKEIISNLDQDLSPGQIWNSNMPYLLAAISTLNLKAKNLGNIADEENEFEELVRKALKEEPNIIISTGAVSKGKWDFIPGSLQSLGAKIIFHRVAIRPAKPVLFAIFPNGTIYFGLPGNPISTAVAFKIFVQPMLRKILGENMPKPKKAKLISSGKKKVGFRFFYKGLVEINDKGEVEATILQGQESFKIDPLIKANCLISLPAERGQYDKGEIVEFYEF